MRRTWKAAIGLTTVAGLLGAASLAWAAIPDGSGVIHGCYKNVDGKLRVIDPSGGGSCIPSETALDWSQTGPVGPVGPTGSQGATGAAGPDWSGRPRGSRWTGGAPRGPRARQGRRRST